VDGEVLPELVSFCRRSYLSQRERERTETKEGREEEKEKGKGKERKISPTITIVMPMWNAGDRMCDCDCGWGMGLDCFGRSIGISVVGAVSGGTSEGKMSVWERVQRLDIVGYVVVRWWCHLML